jgi:hypothetical protein
VSARRPATPSSPQTSPPCSRAVRPGTSGQPTTACGESWLADFQAIPGRAPEVPVPPAAPPLRPRRRGACSRSSVPRGCRTLCIASLRRSSGWRRPALCAPRRSGGGGGHPRSIDPARFENPDSRVRRAEGSHCLAAQHNGQFWIHAPALAVGVSQKWSPAPSGPLRSKPGGSENRCADPSPNREPGS